MQKARLKPCDANHWTYGRWRPVERIRTIIDDDGKGPSTDPNIIKGCRGGGVIIGAQIVQYADKPARFCESWYDYEWNVEIK